ncbi:MAG: CHAD domain-containing protein [Actinobacteria bacterium]|nr:CHAD domain-containing protein [Actinomycetota bacterium]
MQNQTLDHQEIEWQLEAADLEAVESWLEEHPSASGLAVVPETTKELADTYYDTEDWRLYRAGYVLRVRQDGACAEATMKSLAPAEDALRRRREISEPIEGGITTPKGIPGPVGERVRRLAGTGDLRPLFEIHTRRRIFSLHPEASSGGTVEDASGDIRPREKGAAVGEIALDDSEISNDGEARTHLSRIEIEVGSDAEIHDGVGDFVDALRDALGLRPTEASKFRTGLSAAGLSPAVAPDLGPTEIDASLSVGNVAFAILRRHFAAMLAHEPGVRLGEDPEELHDMRVATRRLRAALKLYANVLPRRAERYEKDLRWVAGALGEVRDLDVHLERLSEEASRKGEVLEEVVALLEERRIEARRRMLEALDSNRYERFVASFSGTLRRGRSPAPTGPILEVAPDLVQRRYKKVRKAADALTGDSPPEEFHDLRKKGKRLRYALEPLQGIYGKPSEKMVKLLKTVQDDLGDHQDLIVATELMEELGTAGDLPPRAVFSMGSMAGHHIRDAAEMRADFLGSKQLRALKDGKPWKKLRKAMEKRAGG